MDYLRTLGSAAVSTLVQKSGLNLPFTLGAKVTTLNGVCNLYDGIKRDDSLPVSVFEYDFGDPSKMNTKPLAKNALRKLRTTRHPDILKFLDAVESDTGIYIMTERIRPLSATLQTWASRNAQEREDWLLWGLHRVSVALAFLNSSCLSTHGNVCINSIFISPSGEWKLGGFDVLSNPKEDTAILYTMGGLIPDSTSWAAPEIKKAGWSILKDGNVEAADAYALGLLLHAVFNPIQPPPATAHPPHPPPTPASRGLIPPSVFPGFKRLLNPNPKTRLTPQAFLELGMTDTGFFANNRLVKVCLGLDNFALGSEADKNTLLRNLKESATSFPPEFTSHRVLPSLVSALEFGGASAATILPLVLQFGGNVSSDDYPNVIIAPLIKYKNGLLEHLPEYAEKLDKKTVSEKVFPHLQTGFSDTVAVVREASVKSISLLAPKVIEQRFAPALAKMQMDPEASIRTNTCILIGRLGPSLGYNTKRKVLVPAFCRALKDSFVHARVAGLMAFMATIDCFEVEDLANKVIPNISLTLIDQEKLVRDQAFKAVDLFVKRLESHAKTMPEHLISESAMPGSLPPVQTTLVNSATGAAGALAGWAISSFGMKLGPSDLQTSMGPSPATDRPTSAPPIPKSTADNPSDALSPSFTNSPRTMSATSSPALPSGRGNPATQKPASRAKGLQLGANKTPQSRVLAEQLAEEIEAGEREDSNPWGNEDLIDVNADQDDWSAFETAPIQTQPTPAPVISDTLWDAGEALDLPGSFGHLGQDRPNGNHNSLTIPTSSVQDPWGTISRASASPPPTPSLVTMSKEDKAAEMLRRKEERKQRIALLKEQKKNAAKG
ncbi:hypothetical protein BD779DRAFT_1753347 [Infundibulicybe gibba]|nr:hypothetical protein BD779DRAFT_1753347 [Infundibulicybe gibba]